MSGIYTADSFLPKFNIQVKSNEPNFAEDLKTWQQIQANWDAQEQRKLAKELRQEQESKKQADEARKQAQLEMLKQYVLQNRDNPNGIMQALGDAQLDNGNYNQAASLYNNIFKNNMATKRLNIYENKSNSTGSGGTKEKKTTLNEQVNSYFKDADGDLEEARRLAQDDGNFSAYEKISNAINKQQRQQKSQDDLVDNIHKMANGEENNEGGDYTYNGIKIPEAQSKALAQGKPVRAPNGQVLILRDGEVVPYL